MVEQIRDGTGKGYMAKVDNSNRLRVSSRSASLQHVVSHEEEMAYQVSDTATPTNGTTVVLHIKNTNTTKNMVVTYMRLQQVGLAGGTSLPNTSNYWAIRINTEHSSGGTSLTPTNMKVQSGEVSGITVYGDNPTITGTATEIDRHYAISDGDEQSYNKEGAFIIPPQKTFDIVYVGDHTSGALHARVSFFMETEEI